jgi:hypothetical protein
MHSAAWWLWCFVNSIERNARDIGQRPQRRSLLDSAL